MPMVKIKSKNFLFGHQINKNNKKNVVISMR